MGFAANQFGEQTKAKKISIVIHSAFSQDYMAVAVPATKLSAPTAVVNILPFHATVRSYSHALEITSADYKNSAILTSWINKKIQECAGELNIKFSLQYNVPTKKFVFAFPSIESVSVSFVTDIP
jgi:hypothetical protein